MKGPSFVHLHLHSEYSLADSILKIKPLVAAAVAAEMPALALTDVGNLFGLIKFYENCLDQGVKPLVGAEVQVVVGNSGECGRIVLLAMNNTGYGNLLRLVSSCYTHHERRGVLSEEELFGAHQGLIVLSGGIGGHLWHATQSGDMPSLRSQCRRFQRCFGDRYYVELTRTGREGEEAALQQWLALASEMQLAVVATNDVCFATADDYEAHETRVCIHEGRSLDDPRRERRYNSEQYLKSPAQMADLFADLPEAVSNAEQIAKRCNVRIELGTYYLPDYPIPDNDTPESYLRNQAFAGLTQREETRGLRSPTAQVEDYRARLDFELDVINQMGFAGYFLIVMEFIAWAKNNDIPVGPGRGSGAGSLVAYCLGITDLDPLEYDLLFERFLNPERVSMPDFDVDFCMEGRDRVIHHVSDLYGHDAVSQIITFGTMAAKAVVRDVARVQGKPYGLADKLSKMIPFEVGMTLHKAMEETEELRTFVETDAEAGEIMDMAYRLEGVVRNVGRHAGGVVIAPRTLTDFVPLYTEEAGASLVSQYDKDDVERAGLVKFDFLGLKTLTIIDWSVRAINVTRAAEGEALLDIDTIPLDDRPTFDLLRRADTTGVFQLESRGMKDLIRRLLPDNINDVIALVALFRPGPLQSGAVDDYINRKHRREPVVYPHPSLEPVLDDTYGVVLYQEQVMQIAQELAGFSLGQADLLRRAMGKKKPQEMARVREQFLAGTRARRIEDKLSNDIFDLMEKFAGYAFNKSHSATYAVVSYQTAWLKAHFPAQFMAANLSTDMQNIDRVVVLIDEVRRMGVPLLPPSVNLSEFRFSVRDESVVYGLGAVPGVGEGPVAAIVEARADGLFADLLDFCKRVDGKKANKRVNEALIAAGAFDEFAHPAEDIDATRHRLRAEMPHAMQTAEQAARNLEAGMTDLFGGVAAGVITECHALEQQGCEQMTTRERLQGEKEALGLYLTGHPIDEYVQELKHICKSPIGELRAEKKTQWVSGMVVNVRVMRSRRGAPMGFLVLDDRSARLEVSLFPECYEKFGRKVAKDELLIVEGEVQQDEFSGGLALRAERVYTIAEARERFCLGLVIDYSEADMPGDFSQRLKRVLSPHRTEQDGCNICVLYGAERARARISLGEDWRVSPSDDLLQTLRTEFDGRIHLDYARG